MRKLIKEFLEPITSMSEEAAEGLWAVSKVMLLGIAVMLIIIAYYYIIGW